LSQTEESVRFDVIPESGKAAFQSVARRGYRLQFHGIEGAANRIRLDRQAIPEADADSGDGTRAVWSRNEWSGDVSVFIPPSAPRAFRVEFATERRGDVAPYRSDHCRGKLAARRAFRHQRRILALAVVALTAPPPSVHECCGQAKAAV
jgi:hypothetical protein